MAKNLPKDIIIDILLRLPAKSLVRFKCVCKGWQSLISDQGFAKLHLQRLNAGDLIPSQRIIIGRPERPLQTIDYEALDGGEGHTVVPHTHRINPSRVVGSCDGLVLLIGPCNFLIYNPTTRVYIELPDSNFVDQNELYNILGYQIFCGFGYDSQFDDYKIVEGKFGLGNWEVAIFSLKSGFWRRIQVQYPEEKKRRDVALHGPGVYWNGALHCINGKWEALIMSFDLSEEKIHRVLPVPEVDEIDCRAADSWGLGIHGPNLFIYKCSHRTGIEAWITDVNGRGASWTRWFSVDFNAIINYFDSFQEKFVAYTRSRKIVFRVDMKRMILFNPEDNTYEDYLVGREDTFEYAIYLETLISPYLGSRAVE
ncbi:hypothetical protein BT93_H1345 [Corymbia citriodora subsp. variegata]|nr:hypothetical protein BT93_H1345 [Corymbia citriodora subsp. variegata]